MVERERQGEELEMLWCCDAKHIPAELGRFHEGTRWKAWINEA